MSDVISRKDLIQEIEPLLTWEMLAKINKMPAVDAVPVVHGRWMPMKRYRSEYVCSECGDMWPDFKSDYCPNCGARMDLI